MAQRKYSSTFLILHSTSLHFFCLDDNVSAAASAVRGIMASQKVGQGRTVLTLSDAPKNYHFVDSPAS